MIYDNQTLLTIVVHSILNITTATVKKILYRKPDRTRGEWIPQRFVGTDQMEYDIQGADMPLEHGTWQAQAYVEVGGLKGYGEVFEFVVSKSL